MQREDVQVSGSRQRTAAVLLAVLVVAAFVLRFLRLGHWGLDIDEIFMRRDSIHPRLTNPRPLLYFVNHYLVLPFRPLDELGIRILPALFGSLAIPVLYFVTRRLLNARAALLAALLLTVSGLHVIYSQFGRYWSLVFLLSAVYPYALYLGVRDRNRSAVVAGIVLGVLASLAHPAAVLLVGGPAIWLLATVVKPHHLRALWAQRRVRYSVLVLAAVLVVIAIRFVPILQGWIHEHDANPASGQFLLRKHMPLGIKQTFYLIGFVQGWTFSVVLTAMVGIYSMWRHHDRTLALYLTSVAVFPILFITLASTRTPVSAYYLVPVAPVFFIGSGFFLDRLFAMEWGERPRWLVPVTVLALMMIEGAPTLVSQYLNGRRFDFRGAAHWLRPRLGSRDVIYSDQPVALGFYLPHHPVGRLRYDTLTLAQAVDTVRGADAGGAALWIVAPAPAHALRTNLRQGGLAAWIYGHCQLRNSIGMGRVDFRQQYLQLYQCPPGGTRPARDAGVAGPTAGRTATPLSASRSR